MILSNIINCLIVKQWSANGLHDNTGHRMPCNNYLIIDQPNFGGCQMEEWNSEKLNWYGGTGVLSEKLQLHSETDSKVAFFSTTKVRETSAW